MGNPKENIPPKIGSSKLSGASASTFSYGLFFLVGMGLMGLLRFVGPVDTTRGAAKHASSPSERIHKPWGDVVITRMVLERPEEMFATNDAPAPALRWFFPDYSREQVVQLLGDCELTPEQRSLLLDPKKGGPAERGWNIWPPLETVRELSPSARARIYAVLGKSRENAGPANPFVYRRDGFEEWFSGCELPPERVALVRRLAYPKKNLLCFADVQLFELLSSSNETHCLIKTLCRVPTLLMKVQVNPETDLDGLLAYWDLGGQAKTVKPLLKSLARVPGGELNISYFLPPVPRLRLYTYPDPSRPMRPDCFWSSFNFFNEDADDRFINPQYADQFLQSQFDEVRDEKRFGDIMLLSGPDQGALHMCVYVADDVVYTKNGGHIYQPWVLMKIEDMMVQYPADQPLSWRVFRRKHG